LLYYKPDFFKKLFQSCFKVCPICTKRPALHLRRAERSEVKLSGACVCGAAIGRTQGDQTGSGFIAFLIDANRMEQDRFIALQLLYYHGGDVLRVNSRRHDGMSVEQIL
jgi:hypothetical protein